MKAKYIIMLISGILIFFVLLQNTQVVSIRFLFWKLSMSRIIMLPLLMVVGFIGGFFVGRKTK